MAKNISFTIKYWKQNGPKDAGHFEQHEMKNIPDDTSFLEMLDILNEELINEGKEPFTFDHDCRVFQIRFVYWPQHKLLAMCGDNYPKAVESLFGPQINFQNATDQDYEIDTWDQNIPIFGAIIDGISKAGDETIRSLLGYDEDETFSDEDYARRSAVYKAIFKALDLDNWLYGRDGQFERIKMSGLTSQEKIQDVQRWVRSATQKL